MGHWYCALAGCLLLASSATAQPPWPHVSSIEGLLSRGERSLNAGDSISALSFYRDAIVRSPRDVRGYVALGRAYLQLKEAKNAVEAFEAGVRNTRGSAELALGLAEAYEHMGRPERALATLREQLSTGPGSRQLYESLAALAERRGLLIEALAARRALLALLSSSPDTDESALRAARTHVAALALLLGAADRLSAAHCAEHGSSRVLSQLLACPPRISLP